MKQFVFPKFFLFNCFIFFTHCILAQENRFYYGYKTKYVLTIDSTKAVMVPRDQFSNAKSLKSALTTNPEVVSANTLGNRNEIYVRLKDKTSLKRLNSPDYDLLPSFSHKGFAMDPTGDIVFKPTSQTNAEKILSIYASEIKLIEATQYGTYVIRPKKMANLLTIANKIYESGLVDWCEPDFLVEIVKHQAPVTPGDPTYAQQYYLNQNNNIDINAPTAWGTSVGCGIIRVAVVDDGVENHEDLGNRVVAGVSASNVNGSINGSPITALPPVGEGIIGHGQACAGIIAATHNTLGVAGIAPNSQIIPVNIFTDWWLDNTFVQGQRLRWRNTTQQLANVINWAWDPTRGNADILSNSWGYATTDPSIVPESGQLIQAITDARTQGRLRNGQRLGCVVVFASGNWNNLFAGVTFPANINGVVTVGAIDRNGNIWNYSSRGPEMDVVAPSGATNNQGDVWTTDRTNANGYVNGNYVGTFGGTSAAAPQVSGIAALMLSVRPNLTEAQVLNILRNTATDMGTAGFDNTFGAGRVNAEAALRQVGNIIGPDVLCGGFYSFIFDGPSGAGISSVTWETSANIEPRSGTGTQASIRDVGTGPGWLDFIVTYTNGCAPVRFRRNFVRVGQSALPGGWNCSGCSNPTSSTLNSYQSINSSGSSVSISINISEPTAQASSWQWTRTSGADSYFFGSGSTATIYLSRGQGATYTVSAIVPCAGTTSRVSRQFSFIFVNSGPFAIFPNPASDEVSIADMKIINGGASNDQANLTYQLTSLESINGSSPSVNATSQDVNSDNVNSDFEVEIFNSFQQRVLTAKGSGALSKVSTKGLINGVYAVRVRRKGEIFTDQLIIAR